MVLSISVSLKKGVEQGTLSPPMGGLIPFHMQVDARSSRQVSASAHVKADLGIFFGIYRQMGHYACSDSPNLV